MMTAVRERQRIGLGSLWLPLLLGPFLWGLTEVVLYPVSAQGCYTGFMPPAESPPATGAQWFNLIWVIAAIVLAALAILLAMRSWNRVRAENGNGGAVRVRVRFMALAGLIVSVVFLYAIVMYGIGVVLVGAPCG